jgi:light-regulated signal transduction histidine kinase (bacteriophytochrome)
MRTDTAEVAREFKEFAYVVSHDLGAPLRAMVEFSKMLRTDNPDMLSDESGLYLSMIVENGQKAQAMLSGLLEYSRLNTVEMPFAAVNCNTLLRECEEKLREKITATKAKISSVLLPTVVADANQLRRLFLALFENALTFHKPNIPPVIFVSASKEGNEWVFNVRDNGIGMDPKFHGDIFRPFRRLHAEKDYPSVGMGLALAKKIVDHHGGRIWVESAPGHGSSFFFSIPERGTP